MKTKRESINYVDAFVFPSKQKSKQKILVEPKKVFLRPPDGVTFAISFLQFLSM